MYVCIYIYIYIYPSASYHVLDLARDVVVDRKQLKPWDLRQRYWQAAEIVAVRVQLPKGRQLANLCRELEKFILVHREVIESKQVPKIGWQLFETILVQVPDWPEYNTDKLANSRQHQPKKYIFYYIYIYLKENAIEATLLMNPTRFPESKDGGRRG